MMTYPLGKPCCANHAVLLIIVLKRGGGQAHVKKMQISKRPFGIKLHKIGTKRLYQIAVVSLQIAETVVIGFPFMEPSQSSQQLDYRVQILIVG